ncbi:MAG: CAP domain-containing protein [Coleofasciculus chthonoplastes F3-SA18-01]
MRSRSVFVMSGFLLLKLGLSSCDLALSVNQTPVSQSESPATVSPQSNDGEFTNWEGLVHQQINQYRQSQNLPPLTLDASISKEARRHSQAMATGRVPLGHGGFEQRVRAIAQSMSYRQAAENVAYNQGYSDPATQAVQGWLKSPGHRKNIEGDFDVTGIGVSKNAKGDYYFTQIFIKRQ